MFVLKNRIFLLRFPKKLIKFFSKEKICDEFITNLVPGKVEKENHSMRKVHKSEERKDKNIGKGCFFKVRAGVDH